MTQPKKVECLIKKHIICTSMFNMIFIEYQMFVVLTDNAMYYMHKVVWLAGMWTMLRYLPSNAWTPSFCVEINEKAGPDVVQGTTRMCCRAYCRA